MLKYDDLIHMKSEEGREKSRSKRYGSCLYLSRSNRCSWACIRVWFFSACDKAIVEIKNLVRILVTDFSAANIMITSDHGFLYTYEEFTEVDKISKENFEGLVEYGRRYAIMGESTNPSFLIPIKFVDEKSGLKGFAPKHNVRTKKHGGGINFVHGGSHFKKWLIH